MKNFFFAIVFLLIGTFTFASNNVKDEVINENQRVELSFENQVNLVATKCYRKAIDDFGNIYYVQVICPEVIILD